MNDNPPRFVDAPYSGAVLENASLGMTVMRVTAMDKDEVMMMDFSQIVTFLIIQTRMHDIDAPTWSESHCYPSTMHKLF